MRNRNKIWAKCIYPIFFFFWKRHYGYNEKRILLYLSVWLYDMTANTYTYIFSIYSYSVADLYYILMSLKLCTVVLWRMKWNNGIFVTNNIINKKIILLNGNDVLNDGILIIFEIVLDSEWLDCEPGTKTYRFS